MTPGGGSRVAAGGGSSTPRRQLRWSMASAELEGAGSDGHRARTTEGGACGQDYRARRAQRAAGELTEELGGGAQVHKKER
jgi:hypothetical protein